MATYLQGVTDVIQPFQPFTPNFDFYNQALQLKHEQYQQGYKQLSGLYSTILNSPLTRDENVNRRDQFFKDADKEIKKISGVDLSLPQNVQAASQIFKPFYQDKPMMVDMVVTKSIDDSRQAHEMLKNCVGKDCEKFGAWDEGLKAVEYKREEFKKTGTDESLNFGKVSYTPRVKYAEDVLKFLKEQDFKITREVNTGRYNVTYTNGDLLEKPLYNMIKTLYEDDSSVTAMYDTKAYVARKDYARSNASMFNGSEEEAEKQYLIDRADSISQSLEEQISQMDLELNSSKAKLNLLDSKIKNKGIALDSKDSQEYRYLSQLVPVLEKGKTGLLRNKDAFTDIDSIDIRTLRGRIDGLAANEYFDNDIRDIAHNYSQATSGIESKEDQFALNEQSSALSLRNSQAMAALNFRYDIAKLDYTSQKEAIKKQEEKQEAAALLGAGKPLEITTGEITDDNLSKEDLYITNTKTIESEVSGYMGNMRDVLTDVYSNLYQASQGTGKYADIAKKDFARLFPGAKPDEDTFDKHYSWAKGYKTYEKKYSQVVYALQGNPIYSGLLKDKAGVMKNVNRQKMNVEAVAKLQAENGNRIKLTMKNDVYSELDSDYIQFVDNFFTKQNGIVPKNEFQDMLLKKGISIEDSAEIHDEMTEEYIRQYSDGTRENKSLRVIPFYGQVVKGDGGGAVGAKPVFLNANPLEKFSQNYAAAETILRDIQNSGYQVKEDSGTTVEMVQQFIRDFSKGYDPKKDNPKMPLATFKYEAFSDKKDFAKVTITPDRQWLEENIVGAKKEAESTEFSGISKGFEIYIPKDKANNVLEAGTKSFADIIFQTNNNKVQLGNPNDEGGYAVITKDPINNSYSVFQKIPTWDPVKLQEGEPIYKTNSLYKGDAERLITDMQSSIDMSKDFADQMKIKLENLKVKTNNPQEVLNGK
jgi:hypothetical protein